MSKGDACEATGRVVRVGCMGVGGRGAFLMQTALSFPNVEVPAVSDTDKDAATRAQDIVEAATGKRPAAYTADENDWENLCSRDDLDAVLISTPWEWHAPQAIAAMRTGKFVGLEVPACQTLEEAWDLVRASEETATPCMLLENVNYFRNTLAVNRLIHEGVLGNVHHALAGYIHDCRSLAFKPDGTLTWRGERMAKDNGNLYPTHPIGPIAWWMNINRGDRFVRLTSISTRSRGLQEYAAARFGADHPLAKRHYAQGDTNTTMIETANGATVNLYFDLCSPRPADFIFRVQGTRGCYEGTRDVIRIDGVSPTDDWEAFTPEYSENYDSRIWQELGPEAARNGGHGGCDYIMMHEFLSSVRERRQPPIDVYDAVTWSAIVPLSMKSVAQHGQVVEFPDFTGGRWKTSLPAVV